MNVSELTLLVLRIGFLLLLWMFIFGIVYALRSDLFGQRVRKMKTDAAAPAAAFPASAVPAAVPGPVVGRISTGPCFRTASIVRSTKPGFRSSLPARGLKIRAISGNSISILLDDTHEQS